MLSHSIFLFLTIFRIFLLSNAFEDAKSFAVSKKGNTWSKSTRVHADTVLPVRIALAYSNLNLGEESLMQMFVYLLTSVYGLTGIFRSDPLSPSFADHWSLDKVIDSFAPSQETVNMTTQWLVDSGIEIQRIDRSINRGFLAFDATVSELESLLQTEYSHYEHVTKGHKALACEKYARFRSI